MRVFGEDANALAGRLDHCFDIVYLDPPYNQHQYGSNYHLLNSLVLWDKPLHRSPEAGKAAIRRDWVKTRSAYCYRDSAAHVFASLLESLKARYILVSYSTEGIIPFSDMVDLCSSRGKVIILTDQYTRYRGGRQSPGRVNSNIEMVLIVDTERTSSRTDLGRIQDMVRTRELNLQAGRWYRSAKLRNSFMVDEAGESIGFQVDAIVLWMKTSAFVRIQEPDLGGMLDELPVSAGARRSAKERLADMLRGCECSDRGEELEELIRVVRSAHPAGDALVSEMPRLLRKIAHRKYRDRFEQLLKRVRDVETHRPDRYARIREKVNQVEALAQRRFRG
jgi:adenine-specific DNA-methyltransferase